jgi:hypothetical protein
MDILKRIKNTKASYENLPLKRKLMIFFLLVSLVGILLPNHAQIQSYTVTEKDMVFYIGNYEGRLAQLNFDVQKKYNYEKTVELLKRRIVLENKVEQFLLDNYSPLAGHTKVLMRQNNWKKIIALANAESTLCRRFPTGTNNCWGVGGNSLWQLGTGLDEGIIAMNRFLNTYPLRAAKKYSQMDYSEMNGLYKQPAADHWVRNNRVMEDALTRLENEI